MALDTATPSRSTSPGRLDKEVAGRSTRASNYRFWGGLFAGAALSPLLPWNLLSAGGSGRILALVGAVAGTLLICRLLVKKRAVWTVIGTAGVILGGFVMSTAASLGGSESSLMSVELGAIFFLCGITILIRHRRLTDDERLDVIERLLEEPTDDGRREAEDAPSSPRQPLCSTNS